MNSDSPPVPRPPGAPRRILVVEDEKITRRAVSQLLEAEGYEVIGAEDGADGMRLAQEHLPDLILLDLGLPSDPFGGGNFDGFGVMEWLGRRIQDRRIPIIILTARQDEKSRQHAIDLGASAYLTKPFEPKKLFDAIRITLGDV